MLILFRCMKGLFNRHFWKFLVGFLVIMAVGFFLLVWANTYHDGKNSDESKAEKYLKDLKKAYDEDTYGGKTPEETLQLFIDALKKGDIDLAAKYFVVEKQGEWTDELKNTKETEGLDLIIAEAQKLKLSKNNGNRAFFTLANEQNIVEVQVILALVPNGIWKIVDL